VSKKITGKVHSFPSKLYKYLPGLVRVVFVFGIELYIHDGFWSLTVFGIKMEFENNAWVNVLKSAHKTSLIQDGKFKYACIM